MPHATPSSITTPHRVLRCRVVCVTSCVIKNNVFSCLGLVCGVSSGVLHEEMLGIIDSPKKVQDIVNVIARCRKGVKQFQEQGGQVEELFPSLPICGKQQQCLHSLPHVPTHVMVFDQHGGDSGGRRTRTLLCKRLDDGNLSVLLDLYYLIFNAWLFVIAHFLMHT